MRFHIGFSFSWRNIKKLILPILVGILAYMGLGYFSCIEVHAAPTNVRRVQLVYGTDGYNTIEGFNTFPISNDVKFKFLSVVWNDSEIKVGKTYHVEVTLFGSLSDGFYNYSYNNFTFTYDFNGETYSVPIYNLTMSGGQYKTYEFDFYSPITSNSSTTFAFAAENPDGCVYHQWTGEGTFGLTGLTVTKVADSEDALINQNEVIIGQNQQIIDKQEQTNEKLEETNKELGDLNENLTDGKIDSGTGSDFFDNFESEDNGGISGIITSPLKLINSLLDSNDKCTELVLPILGKDVSLPCGTIIWEKVPESLEILIQTLVCGPGAYFLLVKLFKDINNLKDPNKSEVSTLDL